MILEFFGHRCAYCNGANLKLMMDHVIAISSRRRAFRRECRPGLTPCNSKKNARPVFLMVAA